MASLTYTGSGDECDISDDESQEDCELGADIYDACASMIEEDKKRDLISLLLNNLNERGKRVFIGKLLGKEKVKGGKANLTVEQLNDIIITKVHELGYDRAYQIAKRFYVSKEFKCNYMMGDGYTIFPVFFKIKLSKELTDLSNNYQTPKKRRKTEGSPYGGPIPRSDQIGTPGEIPSSNPRDPFPTMEDQNPDDVAKPFPDCVESPSNLCPSCVTGLCDIHIQLRF